MLVMNCSIGLMGMLKVRDEYWRYYKEREGTKTTGSSSVW